MAVEWGRARITFTMTEREMLADSIAVFLDRDGEWEPQQSIRLRTSYLPGVVNEAHLVSMMKQGEMPETVEIDIPVSQLAVYVDRQLKGMGWRRVSELNSWPATEPAFPGETPNRAAECDLRRGWNERRYLKQIEAARAVRRAEDAKAERRRRLARRARELRSDVPRIAGDSKTSN